MNENKPNPFKTNKPSTSKVDIFFGVPDSTPIVQIPKKGNFTAAIFSQPDSQQENVSQNTPSPQQNILESAQTKKDIQKRLRSFSSKSPIIKIEQPHKQQIQLRMKVDGADCRVSDEGGITKLSDLTNGTIKFELTDAKMQMLQKVQLLQNISNCLANLYLIISSNNLDFLCRIRACRDKESGFIFNIQEINRLLQGLSFYKPNKNKALQIFEIALQNHPLGSQVKQISKRYNLDMLKAYYVVKEIYIAQKKLPKNNQTFNIDIQQNRIIDQKSLVNLAGDFINMDKKHLLLCYGQYLNFSKPVRPSKLGICRVYQQINILWANIHMIKHQISQIQDMIFRIYIQYCELDITQTYVQKQLADMKHKFAEINQQFQSELVERNIELMLTEGNFKKEECSGHYLDLYCLLINNVQIDYKAAIKRIDSVNTLSDKWLKYYKQYLQNITFRQGKAVNISKAAYIYKLLKIFYAKKCLLVQAEQHKLLKEIYTNVSMTLGLKYLDVLQAKSLKIWCLKFTIKYTEKDLQSIQEEDLNILCKFFPQEYEQGILIKLMINLVEKVFTSYIECDNFTTLQTQISCGKSLTFNFDEEEIIYQSVKYYTRIFLKLPSHQEIVQQNIINLFEMLKNKNIKIVPSLLFYNRNLLGKQRNLNIIARHMIFLIKTIDQAKRRVSLIEQWLHSIENQGLFIDFSPFSQVFSTMADNISYSSDFDIEIQVLIKGLYLFRESIYNYINKFNYSHKLSNSNNLTIFLTMSKIIDWCLLTQTQISVDFLQFYKQIKAQVSSLIGNQIQFIVSLQTTLQMSTKINIFYQLADHQSYQSDNFSKCYLSEVINKQRRHKFYEVYSYICSQLKQQQAISGLQAFFYVTQLQQSLSKLLIQQNCIVLASILSKQQRASLLMIQKLFRTSTTLYSYSLSKTIPYQLQKLNTLINCLQDRLFIWLRGQKLTAPLFRKIFDLLIISMNGMQYEYHIGYLQRAIREGFINQLRNTQYRKLGSYALYMICLMLGRNKQSVSLGDERQRSKLQNQLYIFTQIQGCLFSELSKQRNKNQLGQHLLLFVSKLNKTIIECILQPFINTAALKLLGRIKQAMINYRRECGSHKFIDNQLSLIVKYLQVNPQERISGQLNKTPLHMIKCNNHDQFNSLYSKCIRTIQSKLSLQKKQTHINKLIIFISNNSAYCIRSIGINREIIHQMINCKQIALLFLKLIVTILERLSPDYYYHKNNADLIKDIIGQCHIYSRSVESLQDMSFFRGMIRLVTQIMNNSMLSPFVVAQILNPQVTAFLQSIRRILLKWSHSQYQSLLSLNEFQLPVKYYPKGIGSKKVFTLWNLLQFRQKLLLVKDLLLYCRQVNGLIQIKHCGLVETMIQYTNFMCENQALLKSRQCEQKMKVITKLLSSKSMNPSSFVNFIDKQFSFSQLRNVCWNIAQNINYLKFQLTAFEVDFFDRFNPHHQNDL